MQALAPSLESSRTPGELIWLVRSRPRRRSTSRALAPTRKKGGCWAALMVDSNQSLFLGSSGLFLLAIAGLDAASDVLEHAFGALGELPGGLQFEIFVQGFCRAGRGNHLAGLGVGGGFVNQVHALLIVGLRLVRVGRDCLVEGRIGLVHFSIVGQHGSFVVVVLRGAGGILLRRELVSFHRLVNLTRTGFGLA